jgi:hypothetical protein
LNETHPIDRGLILLSSLIRQQPPLEAERLASLQDFFPSGRLPEAAQERAQADGRHLEWFLFERSSRALGDLPIFALEGELEAALGAEGPAVALALRTSRSGVFRVQTVVPGEGLWLEDLASRGALPIAEAEASHDLTEGDLLCGRLYPLGDERYRLSPVMAVFRDPQLAEALESDLERLRSRRRGTLRIAQGELERMFFAAPPTVVEPAPGSAPSGASPGSGASSTTPQRGTLAVREELLELLSAGAAGGQSGLGPERATALLGAFELEARRGERASAASALGELLDAVAFHSQVDLERVRRLCIEHWNSLVERPGETLPAKPGPRAESIAAPAVRTGLAAFQRFARERSSPAGEAADRDSAQRALSAFDAGRARGEDLEALFGQLEKDLGLDGEGEEDLSASPDFPGVIGALVEEFQWERRAEGDGTGAEADGPLLTALAQELCEIGLLEELDGARLARFAVRTALAPGSSVDPMPALTRFAKWIESQHGHGLWTEFERTAQVLSRDLPRLARAQRLLEKSGAAAPSPGLGLREELLQTSLEFGERLGIRDDDGRFVPLDLTAELAAELRPGDRAQIRWQRGQPRVAGLLAPLES